VTVTQPRNGLALNVSVKLLGGLSF
jgi:hypothetical protein